MHFYTRFWYSKLKLKTMKITNLEQKFPDLRYSILTHSAGKSINVMCDEL